MNVKVVESKASDEHRRVEFYHDGESVGYVTAVAAVAAAIVRALKVGGLEVIDLVGVKAEEPIEVL